MVEYQCKTCLKTFNRKDVYNYHLNRKFKCIFQPSQNSLKSTESTNSTTIPHKTGNFECCICHKLFTRTDALKRHEKNTCNVELDNEKVGEGLIDKLLKIIEEQTVNTKLQNQKLEIQSLEIKKLNKKVSDLDKISNQYSKNQNCHNKIQNNYNNINVVAHGSEDMSYLTDDMCKKIMSKGETCLLDLIKEKHFNKNKSEHCNIYIGNRKLQYVITYDGNIWEISQADPLIIDILKTNTNYLVGKYEDLKNQLNAKTKKAFLTFLKKINYEDGCHDIDDIDDVEDLNTYTKGLLKDTKLLLFNKKKISVNETNTLKHVTTELV
jgi:hypothetical protein